MTVTVHRPSKSIIVSHVLLPFLTDLKHKIIQDESGQPKVAVKWDLEAYQKLRGILDCPHPFELYEPPLLAGIYPPMPHQLITARFKADNKRCFDLSEPRTGKSFSTMLTFDFLRKFGNVRRMVIFTTLSTTSTVWHQLALESFSNYSSEVIHSVNPRFEEELKSNYTITIINHDGVKNDAIKKYLMNSKDIDIIVWDEADNLGNSQSLMWKSIRDALKPSQRFIELTGTPTGENPLSVWSMVKLVSPDNVPKYFGAWRSLVMNQICVNPPIWKPKKDANIHVHRALQPAICIRKKDVLNLPELTHTRIECDLSKEQKKMYDSMKKDMLLEHESGEKLLAINASDKVGKLLQIALGAYKTGLDTYQELDCQSRIDAIMRCIRSTPRKTIVFVSFTGALRLYYREISKEFTCEMVYGSVGKKERDRIFTDFQNSEEPRVLLAHPQVCAHGLEMAAADKIVWAAPSQRGLHFLQSNERIASALQKHPMNIYYIGATPIEWKRFDSLIAKKTDQDALLDLYKMVIDHKA